MKINFSKIFHQIYIQQTNCEGIRRYMHLFELLKMSSKKPNKTNKKNQNVVAQPTFTCSKSSIETLEKHVKSVQMVTIESPERRQ